MATDTTTGRQLVVCCDGTNNNLTGQHNDTNVVKLCELLTSFGDAGQCLFYDPGVGNPGELPGATLADRIKHVQERVAGLAFGRGVYENIAECYRFLMQNYQPGDAIYIFGFSRGAFTARSLAGLVNMFGLLRPHMESMLPSLLHVYFSDRNAPSPKAALRNPIVDQTSRLFANAQMQYVEIEFVGVWDTVASVGMWPFGAKITSVPTIDKKRFRHVRHALALDEQRAQFKPRLYKDDDGTYATEAGNPATMRQRWFRGAHCDVGGGYEAQHTGTSDVALAWLVSEAVQCGLRLRAKAGSELLSEAAVLAALPPLPAPLVHSEQRDSCLWALTGLTVRDTHHALVDNAAPLPVTPVEHPSVAAHPLRFPDDTVWAKRRPGAWFWGFLVLGALIVLAHGRLLELAHPLTFTVGTEVPLWPDHLRAWLANNQAFQLWQLSWWLHDGGILQGRIAGINDGMLLFGAPRWATVWDLLLIAAHAYVLSYLVVRAFARHAGLRRAQDAVPRWLNVLGWALPLAVFGDVAENICTWTALTLVANELPTLALVAGVAMTLCSVAKLVGLAGTLLLVLLPGRRT